MITRGDVTRIGALALLLLPLPLLVTAGGGTYQLRIVSLFLVFATLTVALNVAFAHTDQLFLFLGALAGIGTYTTALIADAAGISAWATLPLGALAAGALGATVSYVAARRGMTVIVLAILTLSLQLAAVETFVGAREVTGGSTGFPFDGLSVAPLAAAVGIDERILFTYVLLGVLLTSLVGYAWLRNSRWGAAFDAVRQDPVAAEAAGIDVVRTKVFAGALAAGTVGVVGPLYAQAERYVLPSMFEFQAIDVLVLVMLVLGGSRTLLGPVVGAGAIVLLDEFLGEIGQWRTAALGVLLVVLFLYFRQGIVPKARALYDGYRSDGAASDVSPDG
ncbi:branched-chain amino acid ABC transporter permease [Halorubrum vacuolatum]|uniref:Branched-chain amino acid transport system permease protein n=1 Tax=Halorubrum vacuolatum TaxID=63740 RepID=A0A238UQF2_HALVU|nr:branched-chain amino acid ABC transporter permease [Halorubrum vacuolatum]SNR24208.1 branched-chain amino acid transport system permease protein [Halorubrum vacuolatum]